MIDSRWLQAVICDCYNHFAVIYIYMCRGYKSFGTKADQKSFKLKITKPYMLVQTLNKANDTQHQQAIKHTLSHSNQVIRAWLNCISRHGTR